MFYYVILCFILRLNKLNIKIKMVKNLEFGLLNF